MIITKGALYEDQYTFLSHLAVLLRIGNVEEKSCKENPNTQFKIDNFFKIVPFIRYCGKIL